jgi:hypothetical protein
MVVIKNTLYAKVHYVADRNNPDEDKRIVDKGGELILQPTCIEEKNQVEDLNWLDSYVREHCDIDHEVEGLELFCENVEIFMEKVVDDLCPVSVIVYAAE